MGLQISFAGPVTYPSAHKLNDIVRKISLENILIETDCPWLTPQPMRGKRNEPAFLVHTALKISELKNIPLNEVAEVTTKNTEKLFNLPSNASFKS